MPSVIVYQGKWDPAKISDQVEGRFPLRLIRLILMEMWRSLKTITGVFSAPPGGGGGSGSGGPADLATRIQVTWVANGPYRVDTSVDGGWVAPTALQILGVWLHRTTAGTAGSTMLDLKLNGTTMYTTTANRPTIGYNDADNKVHAVLPDVVNVVQGDVVTVDTITKETGKPQGWRLVLEGA